MDKQSGNQSPFYSSSCSNNRPLSAVMQAVFALSGEVLSRIACVTIEQVYALFADSSITRRTSVVMGKPAVQVSTLTLAHSRQGCTRFIGSPLQVAGTAPARAQQERAQAISTKQMKQPHLLQSRPAHRHSSLG